MTFERPPCPSKAISYGVSFRVTLYYPNGLIPHVGADLEGLWGQRLPCHSIIKKRIQVRLVYKKGANVCQSSEEMEDTIKYVKPSVFYYASFTNSILNTKNYSLQHSFVLLYKQFLLYRTCVYSIQGDYESFLLDITVGRGKRRPSRK